VVPRWGGDTNFMPVLADVRLIPQDLNETYAELKAAVEELLGGT
jgi:ATP adenylyltransferase